MQESDFIPYSCSAHIPALRVLVVAPHPDDEVFGCGGAIARHVESNVPVCVLVLTDGALYGDVKERQLESSEAAKVLGYGVPEFWGYPDRALSYSDALVDRLVDNIAQIGADLVYAPSPWEVHPDHRQAQAVAVAAVRRSAPSVRLAFYEVGVPLRPNVLLDISPVLELKERAMRCFVSQLHQQNYLDHMQALNRFRTYTLPKGVLAAEAFWVVSADELAQSAWSVVMARVSLGLPSLAPLLSTGAASALEPVVRALQTSALPAPEPGAATVCVLIRTIGRPSLLAAISSVVSQSFSGWEIIVVNAGGGSLAALPPALADKVALVLEPGEPLGRSAAANALLGAARGRYAVFLDDDDQLLPDHLHKLVDALEADPVLVAAYGDVQASISSAADAVNSAVYVYQQDFDWGLLQFQNYLPIHSVMFRLQAARSPIASRFDEGLDLFEDWDYWLQLAAKGAFRRVPGVSALYALDAAGGSGHALQSGALRESMLRRLGARQLARWDDEDIVELINWQGWRARDMEQYKQEVSSSMVQIEQARSVITRLDQGLAEQRLEAVRLGHVYQESLEKVTDAQNSVIALGRTIHEQHREIDRLDATLSQAHQDSLKQAVNAEKRVLALDQAAQELQYEIDRRDQLLGRATEELQREKGRRDQLVMQHVDRCNELMQRLANVTAHELAQQHEIEKLGSLRLAHLDQIKGLNEQLLKMYGSTSWRLTRPFRGVKRALGWLAGKAPGRVLRNGLRAVKGDIRRHSVRGFVERLPHYWRHRKTYGAVLVSPLPQENAQLFKTALPMVTERRLHPDLLSEPVPIDATISIVIPTFNAGLEFRWLLRKLQTQKGLRQLDIVIVDSGSQDNTVVWAHEFGCRVVEITQAEFSHSHARNLGADHATTDYVIFMVQDAYPVGEYWAYGMLRYLLDHAESGLVAASCSEYSRSDSDMMYDSMIDTHYRFLGCHDQDRLGDYQGADHMALRSRGQLSDVACLISKEVFGKYRYQGDYAEDLDLGIRLIKDGHRVAMLASVKVVHSHNRAAFYYLKRSYVDVIFLVGMFDDFLVPAVDSVQGLLAGIFSCAMHVSQALPLLDVVPTEASLGHVLTQWVAGCRKQCGVLSLDGVSDLGDKRLDSYVNGLRSRFDPAALDSLALGEARRFADSFFARLDHFNGFITGVYGAQDHMLKAGLKEAICKTFAATAGSVLGFMYMDKLGSTQPDQYLVDLINDELRGGV